MTFGRSSGTARVGGILAAAWLVGIFLVAQAGRAPAIADTMALPSPGASATPFYGYPYATPPDDVPLIYHSPLPIPSPLPSGAVAPSPGPTSTTLPLAQGNAQVTADQMYGNGGPTGDITALGSVDIKYADVDIIADQAVYHASTKIITATGHVHFTDANGDTATAQSLDYDTVDGHVVMTDVVGQSSSLYAQG
ncbi:MAG TPA: hypothetical protein VEV38_01830, partial [Candidatus Eremiobacteraceae bacterium]|nr:hypothetical protein [Candidatus Eremiobacteraceae bacterium]